MQRKIAVHILLLILAIANGTALSITNGKKIDHSIRHLHHQHSHSEQEGWWDDMVETAQQYNPWADEDESDEEPEDESPVEHVMTPEEEAIAAETESEVKTWLRNLNRTKTINWSVEGQVAVPLQFPNLKVTLRVWGSSIYSESQVDFEGEIGVGIELDLAVELKIDLVGYAKVSCPGCDDLLELFKLLSCLVIRDYADDQIQSMLSQNKVAEAHATSMLSAFQQQLSLFSVRRKAELDQGNFGWQLNQLKPKLDECASIVFGHMLNNPGETLDESSLHILDETEKQINIFIEDYEINLKHTYEDLMKTYNKFGVIDYNSRTAHRMKILAKKNVHFMTSVWHPIIEQTRLFGKGGPVSLNKVSELQDKFRTAFDSIQDQLMKGDLPPGYLALQEDIGYDSRVALHKALDALEGMRENLQNRELTVDVNLGLSLSGSIELGKSAALSAEIRGVLGTEGTVQPLKPEVDTSTFTNYGAVVAGASACIKEVNIHFVGMAKFYEDSTAIDIQIALDHPLIFEDGLLDKMKDKLQQRGLDLWNALKEVVEPNSLVMSGAQDGSVVGGWLRQIPKKLGEYIGKNSGSSSSRFTSAGKIKVGGDKSGPVYILTFKFACPKNSDKGCNWTSDGITIEVGFAGSNLELGHEGAKVFKMPVEASVSVNKVTTWKIPQNLLDKEQ